MNSPPLEGVRIKWRTGLHELPFAVRLRLAARPKRWSSNDEENFTRQALKPTVPTIQPALLERKTAGVSDSGCPYSRLSWAMRPAKTHHRNRRTEAQERTRAAQYTAT